VGAWYQFLRLVSGSGLLLCNVDGRWVEGLLVLVGFRVQQFRASFALERLGVSIDIL
jgi:hypothetical protein